MPRLAYLNLPSFTPDILEYFSKNRILTVEDFLLTDTCSLPGLAEVGPEGHILREAVADLLTHLAAVHAGQWLSGEQLLEAEQNAFLLPIGCQSFDDLLGGGLREGTLTELVGTTASGKTQLRVLPSQRSLRWCT